MEYHHAESKKKRGWSYVVSTYIHIIRHPHHHHHYFFTTPPWNTLPSPPYLHSPHRRRPLSHRQWPPWDLGAFIQVKIDRLNRASIWLRWCIFCGLVGPPVNTNCCCSLLMGRSWRGGGGQTEPGGTLYYLRMISNGYWIKDSIARFSHITTHTIIFF
jgi:hypothetical protein